MTAAPQTATGGTVLQVSGLTIDLPPGGDRPHAVEDISFDLRAEEILCLVGESGSGKSLTALAMMGLLPPPHVRVSAGSIVMDGADLLRLSATEMRARRGRDIAMIFQEPMSALNPVMTIGDQIGETIVSHQSIGASELRQRVVELLGAVRLPEPERLLHTYPFRLSGGQRQRAMIAMALAIGPRVLIADEPTTALDVTTQAEILRLIKRLQGERRMAVLLVTHDFGVVAEVAHRVAVMREGRIVEIGEAATVLNHPRHDYTRMLIRAVPRFGGYRSAVTGTDMLLAIHDARKTFVTHGVTRRRNRYVKAVDGVTLSIRRGETLGLVGESGSGKSTLARCIVRLYDLDGGSIEFAGGDIAKMSLRQFRPLRKRIQMVFQDPYGSLNPRQKIGTIVTAGPRAGGMPRREALAKAVELLRLVGLDGQVLDRYPHEFSGGQRQRISLARALIMEPDVLVADEPVSALDVSVQAQVLALLADLRRRFQFAMLFVTHDLRIAAEVADKLAVMHNGVIVEEGDTRRIFESPTHPYTKSLLDAIPGRAWTPPASVVGQ